MDEIDFFTVANPDLVWSFKETERTFSLDKDCSIRELQECFEESEASDPEEETQDQADGSLNESLFTNICQCTLGSDGSPCFEAIGAKFAIDISLPCVPRVFFILRTVRK